MGYFQEHVSGNIWSWHVLSGDDAENCLTSLEPLFSIFAKGAAWSPFLLILMVSLLSPSDLTPFEVYCLSSITAPRPHFWLNILLHQPTPTFCSIRFSYFKTSLCIFKATACYLVSKTCPQLKADFTPASYRQFRQVWRNLSVHVSIINIFKFNLPTVTWVTTICHKIK